MATNYMMEYNMAERKQLGAEILSLSNEANYKKDAICSINITNMLVACAIKKAESGAYEFEVGTQDDLDWETLCEFRSNYNLQQLVARHLSTFQLTLEERDVPDCKNEAIPTLFVSWGVKKPGMGTGTLVIDAKWSIEPYKMWLPISDKR